MMARWYDEVKDGAIIEKRFQVVKRLGAGSFGAVFQVTDLKGSNRQQQLALKIEIIDSNDHLLKIEANVFADMKGLSRHMCKFVDAGQTQLYHYLVMTLVGPNLNTLRKKFHGQKFTKNTTMLVLLQCMECLKDVHKAGWIHRDVKPSNFAIGRVDSRDERTIFVLDFGLARKYIKNDKEMRQVRREPPFRGTLRYCSINAHNKLDMGRRDDLISLIYMTIELLRGALPWKAVSETNDEMKTFRLKRESFPALYTELGLPYQFITLHNYLHCLACTDEPKYDMIEEAVYHVLPKDKVESTSYDWETVTTNE